MFDLGISEMAVIAVIAIVAIGPKQLPEAMMTAGRWVARIRGVMRQVREGFDDMVREAELKDMEKKWADENARIMREHPAGALTADEGQMRPLPPPAEPSSSLPADNSAPMMKGPLEEPAAVPGAAAEPSEQSPEAGKA
ncbi:Sec-independent protein translocase protein TatB [Novosphingopyxis sp.]|uniref:Sec-independent protein translocase protein TatB n=1 Tax=Novosphingopyxis sp. TaxID=2709690 RepID=UPI003B5BD580